MLLARKVLMVRPAAFGYNEQTAGTNSFQHHLQENDIPLKALAEFDSAVELLMNNGVEVFVYQDTEEPVKPDAIFPNNWFCTTPQNELYLFPMCHPNRRTERIPNFGHFLQSKGLTIAKVMDLSELENRDVFLEGTGSLILDHQSKTGFATLSPRTHPAALELFSAESGYSIYPFHAFDAMHRPIYHTNVLLALSPRYAILCMDCIPAEEQAGLITQIELTGRSIIPISMEQMLAFAGNMLCLTNKNGENLLCLSRTAFESLNSHQLQRLEEDARLIVFSIPLIESIGGGSIRCMIAELFQSQTL
jgi:hypothetical protein